MLLMRVVIVAMSFSRRCWIFVENNLGKKKLYSEDVIPRACVNVAENLLKQRSNYY